MHRLRASWGTYRHEAVASSPSSNACGRRNLMVAPASVRDASSLSESVPLADRSAAWPFRRSARGYAPNILGLQGALQSRPGSGRFDRKRPEPSPGGPGLAWRRGRQWTPPPTLNENSAMVQPSAAPQRRRDAASSTADPDGP